ncbi:hypothetical protein, partial [Weissella confusa]|uniref:hypothetical protein n=1 Tax=Weissella confusa TaxID=1583 RepID=UPI0021A357E3
SSGFQAGRRGNTLRLRENGTPLPPAYIVGRSTTPLTQKPTRRDSDDTNHHKIDFQHKKAIIYQFKSIW